LPYCANGFIHAHNTCRNSYATTTTTPYAKKQNKKSDLIPGLLLINGPCAVKETCSGDECSDQYLGDFSSPETSKGGWDNGANKETSVGMTLADGGPTTYGTFMNALLDCTVDKCDAYIIISIQSIHLN
jgi:hypothetical protein